LIVPSMNEMDRSRNGSRRRGKLLAAATVAEA
jgi:hypothetical protein